MPNTYLFRRVLMTLTCPFLAAKCNAVSFLPFWKFMSVSKKWKLKECRKEMLLPLYFTINPVNRVWGILKCLTGYGHVTSKYVDPLNSIHWQSAHRFVFFFVWAMPDFRPRHFPHRKSKESFFTIHTSLVLRF